MQRKQSCRLVSSGSLIRDFFKKTPSCVLLVGFPVKSDCDLGMVMVSGQLNRTFEFKVPLYA